MAKAQKKESEHDAKREIVQVQFVGELAERFRRYKEIEHIRPNAVAGEKLMLERLEEWEKEHVA